MTLQVGADRVVIWRIKPPHSVNSIESLLVNEELDWVRNEAQVVRAAARAALRQLLGDAIGLEATQVEFLRQCRHCGDARHGKPSVLNSPFRFSVSHTSGLGLIAISMTSEVGVDLEFRKRERNDLQHRLRSKVLTDFEQSRVDNLEPSTREQAFLRLWTSKEAVSKADGRGLMLGLDQIEVGEALSLATFQVQVDDTVWTVQPIDLESCHIGALATSRPAIVELHNWLW